MVKIIKVLRKSIHAFLHDYHSLASIAAILVFPFSAAVLSQSLAPSSSLLTLLHSRIQMLFHAASFPASSHFFALLNLKLSQTIFSFIVTLPFTLTFLLLAKACIILIVGDFPCRRSAPPRLSSLLPLYFFLLPTHLFNYFVILSTNAAFFSILFLAFNVLDALCLSDGNIAALALPTASAILYSIMIANTVVVCNVAAVVAATERCGGYHPFLRACVVIRGREAAAITLAVPANLGLAGVEALFQYRVVKPWWNLSRLSGSVVGEAFLITYIHSMLVVVDVIISCMVYRSCRKSSRLGEKEILEA
ncbi:hypothetical protein KSP40_PGU007781 [Platanthera guangdongensis]|uniref:Uncharacterized protein n=1 Tax=Platanthera guangdongensis TaxID=2320717 RepID=A0ABR2LJU0_9ASPA